MRRLLIIVVLIVVAVGGYLLLRGDPAAEEAQEALNQLQTMEVTTGEVILQVSATGEVEAVRTAGLTFNTAGVVAEVLVEQGDIVQEGQPLVRLDNEPQRFAVEQAELALQIAELNLQTLQEPPSESELYAAQAAVNSAWTAYVDLRDNSVDPESIRIAELRYQQALAAVADAEQAYRDSLQSEISDAARGAASFSAEIARLQLEQIQEGVPQSSLDAAQAQVAQAQAQLAQLEAGPTQAQLDQAAVAVEQAALALSRAQSALEDTILTAPFSGVVSALNVQTGGLVSPGALPVVELVDFSQLFVTVEVDEIDIALVEVGQPVTLTLDALPDQPLEGTVSRVADVAAQGTGIVAYEVRIDIGAADAPVRVGMTAAATITVEEVQDVLVVPNYFIRIDRSSDRAYVNVLTEDDGLEEREVVLGIQNDEQSEIRSGLVAGEVVAIDLNADSGGVFSFFGDE